MARSARQQFGPQPVSLVFLSCGGGRYNLDAWCRDRVEQTGRHSSSLTSSPMKRCAKSGSARNVTWVPGTIGRRSLTVIGAVIQKV
jgi:hypothetical protein